MTVTINLKDRYRAAFGSMATATQPSAATVSKEGKKYTLELYQNQSEDYEEMSFEFDGKKVEFASIPFLNSSQNSNILAPPPLLFFSREKKHIVTEINGSDDEVVERWKTKQYNIRMRGILVDLENHHYPEDKITELNDFFEYNGVVDVSGTQFFDKSISSVYINSLSLNGVVGFPDTIQFTMTLRAIKPVGFTLLNPDL